MVTRRGDADAGHLAHSALAGITRDTVIKLARDAGIEVRESARFPRELLYLADELFFTGTAVEVTPDPLG